MSRKRTKEEASGFALFDVLYEDGSRSSNRRVDRATVDGFDGEAAVRAAIEEQDRIIAERSQRPRPSIKTISPSQKARRA